MTFVPRDAQITTDVCLIGAGPLGLELAVALKREGVDYVHLEAGQVGQTMSWWAPGTRWFSSNERISIAGVPLVTPDQSKATREEYLAYLRQIVGAFELKIRTFEPVTEIQRHPDGTFTVTSVPRSLVDSGAPASRTHCQRIILATGGTDFPRSLGVEGENLPHVDGYLREPHRYFGRKLLIIGGRNSAVEAALRCHHAGARVTLVCRRPQLPEQSIKYWLLPEIKSLLKSGRIEGYFGHIVTGITPAHVSLARCNDALRAAGQAFDVEADEVLKLIGYEQDKTLFRKAGLELTGDEQRPVFDERTMQSSVTGIYVAGTAVAGTQQKFRVFLENCHVHVPRIINHLLGRREPDEATALARQAELAPES
jgi:thioredoxin reductase (NADPH)